MRGLQSSVVALMVLAGCDGGAFDPAQMFGRGAAPEVAGSFQEVEAPHVFSVSEAALWDGRPSLGGVWVAHPEVKDPERVTIRNPENGKSVVGALYRREKEIPGPRVQVSSDGGDALGMQAGVPVVLTVTALRRETVQQAPAAEQDMAKTASAPVQRSQLEKPFLQVGIFSVKANAERTARLMRDAGMLPIIRTGQMQGVPFWRVIVGPAADMAERGTLLAQIKTEGFTDAYPVTN